MKRRQWAILGGAALLVFAVLLKNFLAASAEEKAPIKRSPTKAIDVQTLVAGDVAVQIPIDGPVRASQKIEIYAEINGILKPNAKAFKEGQYYKKGELLLILNDSEAKSAYRSARSNYTSILSQVLPDIKLDYPQRFDHYYSYLQALSGQQAQGLARPPEENDEKLNLFLSGRGLRSAYESAEAARIRLEKFQIKAPFDGSLTEVNVEVGQLVRAGQILGEFIGEGSFEMLSSLSPRESKRVQIGDSVKLESTSSTEHYKGIVFRKNSKIDPNTQRIGIYVLIQPTSRQKLADGEYLRGALQGRSIPNAMALDRKLLMDEKSIYVVEDSLLAIQEVEVLQSSPDQVIIKAPKASLVLPKTQVPGAFPGMKVRILKRKKS
jgi:membrane fusion protein (multidrug efflux system)